MKPAGSEPLLQDQLKFQSQLAVAVKHINEADDLLAQNSSDLASNRATALLLSAVARIFVLETAEKYNMSTRIPVFKNQPK